MTRSLSREELCIHQVCLWKQSTFGESLDCLARYGVFQTALWKPLVEDCGWKKAAKALEDSGVTAIAFCPLVVYDPEIASSLAVQTEANQRLLERIAELGVDSVVVITGGLSSDSTDLSGQRAVVTEELAKLVPTARSLGIKLALEPLHPMVCGTRTVLSSLREANAMLDALEAEGVLGVAVDSYALWWDAGLQEQIEQSKGRIRHLHVSDWLPNTRDVRHDRGMPGDGLIDNARIRSWVEAAGYEGSVEVEIFSAYDWWLKPAEVVVQTICGRLQHL